MLWLSTYIGARFGWNIGQEIQENIIEIVVAIMIYAITHKAVDSRINPNDVAKPDAIRTLPMQPKV